MALHLESCLSSLKPQFVQTTAQPSQSSDNIKLDSLHVANKWSISAEEERRSTLIKHVCQNFNLLLSLPIFF